MTIKNLPADYLLAAQQGDIDKVKTALRWVSILIPAIATGKRQLRWQVYISNMLCVQALIDAGADINKQDHTCLNPF